MSSLLAGLTDLTPKMRLKCNLQLHLLRKALVTIYNICLQSQFDLFATICTKSHAQWFKLEALTRCCVP